MTTLRIDVSDDIKTQLASRAAESGFDNVEDYARALLLAEAKIEDLPPHIEQLLSNRLNDPRPGIEFNQQFQDDFQRQLKQQRQDRTTR